MDIQNNNEKEGKMNILLNSSYGAYGIMYDRNIAEQITKDGMNNIETFGSDVDLEEMYSGGFVVEHNSVPNDTSPESDTNTSKQI